VYSSCLELLFNVDFGTQPAGNPLLGCPSVDYSRLMVGSFDQPMCWVEMEWCSPLVIGRKKEVFAAVLWHFLQLLTLISSLLTRIQSVCTACKERARYGIITVARNPDKSYQPVIIIISIFLHYSVNAVHSMQDTNPLSLSLTNRNAMFSSVAWQT
jgi:hypothetical protein